VTTASKWLEMKRKGGVKKRSGDQQYGGVVGRRMGGDSRMKGAHNFQRVGGQGPASLEGTGMVGDV